MKNKYVLLILGFILGVIITAAVCWFWCCGGCCQKSCCVKECTTVQVIDVPDFAPITISLDTAQAYFQCYLKNPDTVGIFLAYTVNLPMLDAMNMLRNSDSTLAGFRIYPGVFGDPTDVTVILGVDETASDDTTTIYPTGAPGSGPGPTICDSDSPIAGGRK